MNLKNVKPTGIKANLASREIQITLIASMTEENMEAADALAVYLDREAPRGTLEFIPQQPGLFLKDIKPEMRTVERS
jgi:hypothetical protein